MKSYYNHNMTITRQIKKGIKKWVGKKDKFYYIKLRMKVHLINIIIAVKIQLSKKDFQFLLIKKLMKSLKMTMTQFSRSSKTYIFILSKKTMKNNRFLQKNSH
jgi:hypothetical protein